MTNERTFPITAREATSQHEPAVVSELTANEVGDASHPPAIGNIGERFAGSPIDFDQQFGRLQVQVMSVCEWDHSTIALVFGLDPADDGEAMYTVWLETDPRNAEVRARVHELAQKADLTARGWALSFEGWWLVIARAHTVNFPSLPAAVEWFLARFGDLQSAGLFQLQKELTVDGGAPPPAEEEMAVGIYAAEGDS